MRISSPVAALNLLIRLQCNPEKCSMNGQNSRPKVDAQPSLQQILRSPMSASDLDSANRGPISSASLHRGVNRAQTPSTPSTSDPRLSASTQASPRASTLHDSPSTSKNARSPKSTQGQLNIHSSPSQSHNFRNSSAKVTDASPYENSSEAITTALETFSAENTDTGLSQDNENGVDLSWFDSPGLFDKETSAVGSSMLIPDMNFSTRDAIQVGGGDWVSNLSWNGGSSMAYGLLEHGDPGYDDPSKVSSRPEHSDAPFGLGSSTEIQFASQNCVASTHVEPTPSICLTIIPYPNVIHPEDKIFFKIKLTTLVWRLREAV